MQSTFYWKIFYVFKILFTAIRILGFDHFTIKIHLNLYLPPSPNNNHMSTMTTQNHSKAILVLNLPLNYDQRPLEYDQNKWKPDYSNHFCTIFR
jgi:hypothetical protein